MVTNVVLFQGDIVRTIYWSMRPTYKTVRPTYWTENQPTESTEVMDLDCITIFIMRNENKGALDLPMILHEGPEDYFKDFLQIMICLILVRDYSL